ncbi:PaaI family thioesterase [Thermoflavimicrobium dichotomicum]|uniref:Uncharacterized domain 1-containing protein n=1 Tax=Thermoflavimicrobium dichotomicum TaxID=46223 RepID=A0A1I3MLJ3_9BACL|nr:PaaI family thioesterase [Thermoflavimicrobium dichotomicum]SFI97877.1 uncharacterized domain 1-containing protein [Thermoflavimicrobium dichotomicum]
MTAELMTPEHLFRELEDLRPYEIKTIHKLVEALKRTRDGRLAYIEALMDFQRLGFDKEKGAYVHRMLIKEELMNRYNILHGGITATFIDTAMASSIFQELGEEAKVVTADLSVRFLSPGIKGCLTAYTNVVKKGKTIIVLESKVEDERKRKIATASSTFFRIQ